MPKDHRLRKRPASRISDQPLPLNFLLGCSERSLSEFELRLLNDSADLRKELHVVLDHLIDKMAQAGIAAWFRTIDRQDLKVALENPDDVMAWAREQIRNQRQGDQDEEDPVPLPSLPPGAARLAAAVRYQQRNIADGKCMSCPKPLDPHSVRYCTEHLAMARSRKQTKDAKPGTLDYLYAGEQTDPGPGRSPDNLTRLATHREQKTRAVLAELGISPEHAAVSLNAAVAALLKCMPREKADALTQGELFAHAMIPTRTTGQKALKKLLVAGEIERIGKGGMNDEYRYFISKR